MPGPDVIAVPALGRVAGGGAEIGEVAVRIRREVVMVPDRGSGSIGKGTPRRLVTLLEVLHRA